jgi:hypothetical protein
MFFANESKEILVDHVGVGGEHAVREAGIDFQRATLEQFDREQRGVFVRNNLIVVPVHHERRHVDVFQVFRLVRLERAERGGRTSSARL